MPSGWYRAAVVRWAGQPSLLWSRWGTYYYTWRWWQTRWSKLPRPEKSAVHLCGARQPWDMRGTLSSESKPFIHPHMLQSIVQNADQTHHTTIHTICSWWPLPHCTWSSPGRPMTVWIRKPLSSGSWAARAARSTPTWSSWWGAVGTLETWWWWSRCTCGWGWSAETTPPAPPTRRPSAPSPASRSTSLWTSGSDSDWFIFWT